MSGVQETSSLLDGICRSKGDVYVRRGDTKREDGLEHYRQAGNGLLKLRLWLGRGKFEPVKARISSRLDISRARLGHLMKLANEWPVDWERWQEICGNKKPSARLRKNP